MPEGLKGQGETGGRGEEERKGKERRKGLGKWRQPQERLLDSSPYGSEETKWSLSQRDARVDI